MMIKNEAERLAAAVNQLRPDWAVNRIFAVLKDERICTRPYRDIAPVMVALAVDPESKAPTRLYADGPWWLACTSANASAGPQYRPSLPTDCDICSLPEERHIRLGADTDLDHQYAPRGASGPGVKPNDRQRDAIDAMKAAVAEARAEAKAKHEERVKARREHLANLPSVDETLAKHADQDAFGVEGSPS